MQVRGHEPRRIAFRIGVVEAGCLGAPRLPALGGRKKGKYQKWGDDRHMEVGQDRELYPNLPLIGVVLHSVPHQRQKGRRQRATKSGLERGWCGRIKKERPVHSFFRPIDTSAES